MDISDPHWNDVGYGVKIFLNNNSEDKQDDMKKGWRRKDGQARKMKRE